MRTVSRGHKRLVSAFLVMIAAGAFLVVAPAAPAQAASCSWRDGTTIDSGVSRATGNFYRCVDAYGTYFRLDTTLWDTACDNRTAYLDMHWEGASDSTISVSGCGKSVSWVLWEDPPVYGVKLRTRACNLTCSSSASDWLYP